MPELLSSTQDKRVLVNVGASFEVGDCDFSLVPSVTDISIDRGTEVLCTLL